MHVKEPALRIRPQTGRGVGATAVDEEITRFAWLADQM